MATITYNGLNSPQNIITFTDVPNILKVTATNGGYKAYYTLTFVGDLYGQTTADRQWYITLFGETITNVLDYNNAVNKSFYVAQTANSTASSVAKALRNCANIAANFTVEQDGASVEVRSRDVGSIFYSGFFDTNIAQAYMSRSGTDGSVYQGSLQGALIDVDVYKSNEYITTLEKSWYNGEAAFDMSPVLTTLASDGKTQPYSFKVTSLMNGEYALLGNLENNYISVGYMVNQGYKYIPLVSDTVELAQNVSRGKDLGYTNKTLLYVYQPNLRISTYCFSNVRPYITVKYLDSAHNFIANSTSSSWPTTNTDDRLNDLTIDLNPTYFNKAFYVQVEIGEDITLLYQVIKPLKATEYSQRVFWRNSYGGISFFDFTGQRSETRDVNISTYQKNIFGFYDSTMKDYKNGSVVYVPYNELEKPYDNDVKYTVTLKSHLFEHDGKYIFNDLIQSSKVWTTVNGQNYAIILDSVSVDETDRNDIYEATVRYHYSQEPSLI